MKDFLNKISKVKKAKARKKKVRILAPVNHKNNKLQMKRDPIKMKMMKIREKMERILWYKNLLMIKIGGQLEVKISEKTRIDSNIIDH